MNDTQTLTLRNDYLFKLLLGSEENKACLQDFLECVLDIPAGMIEGLELLDKELAKDVVTDKTGILDVKIRLNNGTTIDIEIQNSWSLEFIPRTLFYWAKMYSEDFKEGEPYTSLTKCITINLVSQGFKLNNQIHSAYRILEQQSYQQLTELLEIHFLNLSLASQFVIQKGSTEKQQKLINWLQFINTDDKEVRTMLAMTSPILQMLNEKIDVLSLTPEERKLYESRMKLKSDIATISEVQFNAGRQEGKLETARILKQLGDSVQKIMQATGLSQAEVEALN
ncbi:PD-(D/E)XK nuclease family transposase [Treponema sp. OMZ 305]|uniref:Rpn family recombination-promoting nuclease/putative transposase n=1 Tax=Treponema sp. OMZ 305 TaxID=1659192 RepID=UPI0020A351CD|nr:Rpn family recombination-promoting nuclease/putative transposase [Treponema sp. OMZ 305]UTC56908.1 PD-(D/E)XK nuclease family transposase [Treponema sp. OMZ 305]